MTSNCFHNGCGLVRPSCARVLSMTVGKVTSAFFACLCLAGLTSLLCAQELPKSSDATSNIPKKTNVRPAEIIANTPEPFDKESVEKMAAQCVSLETEMGVIEIEMIPEAAPESVRGFLNLAATGSLDTTTFSRVVKDFVIQGGNLSTSEKWGYDLAKRMTRKLPDDGSGQACSWHRLDGTSRTDK